LMTIAWRRLTDAVPKAPPTEQVVARVASAGSGADH